MSSEILTDSGLRHQLPIVLDYSNQRKTYLAGFREFFVAVTINLCRHYGEWQISLCYYCTANEFNFFILKDSVEWTASCQPTMPGQGPSRVAHIAIVIFLIQEAISSVVNTIF
jgi:hypothetical protein